MLIPTDTCLSLLVTALISKWLIENNIDCATHKYIEDLRINDAELFIKKGVVNLFKTLDSIVAYGKESADFFLLNITGGYKGLIPYVSTFGHLTNIKTIYLFEDTDQLIWLPLLPIEIDYSIFQEYYNFLLELQEGIIDNWTSYQLKLNKAVINLVEVLSDESGKDLIGLNAVGTYLFDRFNDSILLKILKSSSIFSENEGNKKELRTSICELYNRLIDEISNNNLKTETEINRHIVDLGGMNDLRHGHNPSSSIYIFKSTNKGQIRLVYGIEYMHKKLALKLYDYKRGQFDHSTYIDEFKKKFKLVKELAFISTTIK